MCTESGVKGSSAGWEPALVDSRFFSSRERMRHLKQQLPPLTFWETTTACALFMVPEANGKCKKWNESCGWSY
jgi:hypothetical protein